MITCALQGGLGNQMFQIASTMGHATKFGLDYGFDLNYCHTPAQGNTAIKYKENFYKKVNLIDNISSIKDMKVFREKRFSYQEIPNLDNLCLIGYFQSDKYFNHIRDKIKDTFVFDDITLNKVRDFMSQFSNKTCAVQIRRGDYIKASNFHLVCNIEYYKKSMNLLGEDITFILISDDINWCKENFIGENIKYSPFTDEVTDMCLISECDDKIISNSSFGWWGSWLSDKVGNTVCPQKWFNFGGPQDFNDVYVDGWIKI